MMTTSYPHNGGMHPQGLPQGHPMGGPGQHPGQQMPPGMHPGVSGPNGAVSQPGPMMGMQPGMGGPNAHALQHLQPQQAHMFAQQQQQHPSMMTQAQLMVQQNAQRQTFMRQQQHNAMLAQQQGAMPMGFQNSMPHMTPQQQQMIAMRTGQMGQQFVALPPHLQLQQQHQQMQAQQQNGPQQAAAMAQAAQAHQAAQHHQQLQQQQQQQQQAQAIAMQHAHSQQSNHSQNANQVPPATSQPPQGPLRPPSAMSHHASPQPPPTPQQAPPQQPPPLQQPPQPSGPQPGQQTPAPSQPPNLPQQPNQQPQNPAQMQQRNPAMVQAQAQAAQLQAVQAQANQRNLMIKQAQASTGQGTLKLMNFVDQIGRFHPSIDPDKNALEWWQNFVEKFFTESGAFIHSVYNTKNNNTKQFEIVYAALPRYFYTLFNTDVANLQITLDGATEKAAHPELRVTCDRAKFIYTYKNQCQVIYSGRLTAFWSHSDRMEWLQFDGSGHQQMIPRATLEQMFHQPSPNQMNPNQSPRMNKNAKLKQQQQQRTIEPPEPYLPMSKLPNTGITDHGLPPVLQSYLEIYETMNNMTSLISHYLEKPNLTPTGALESYLQDVVSKSQLPANPNNPTSDPSQTQFLQSRPPPFMSPAMATQLLGSPGLMQTPSPNGHTMVKQQSTSSHTASVNTSPNITGKRRRSTAKMDGDGDDGSVKVKASPRVGGGKRMKGGN